MNTAEAQAAVTTIACMNEAQKAMGTTFVTAVCQYEGLRVASPVPAARKVAKEAADTVNAIEDTATRAAVIAYIADGLYSAFTQGHEKGSKPYIAGRARVSALLISFGLRQRPQKTVKAVSERVSRAVSLFTDAVRAAMPDFSNEELRAAARELLKNE